MKLNIDRLNCMNYHIEMNVGDDGFWYGQNGIRSIWRNAKHYNEDFKAMITALNKDGQYVGHTINITMI